jgi:hypothetical protein
VIGCFCPGLLCGCTRHSRKRPGAPDPRGSWKNGGAIPLSGIMRKIRAILTDDCPICGEIMVLSQLGKTQLFSYSRYHKILICTFCFTREMLYGFFWKDNWEEVLNRSFGSLDFRIFRELEETYGRS